VFYVINKFEIIVKEKWRVFLKENQKIYKPMPNPGRLSVEEMSIA
jgi:hypothetical protein